MNSVLQQTSHRYLLKSNIVEILSFVLADYCLSRSDAFRPEHVISPAGVNEGCSVGAQDLVIVADIPVFCVPSPGPTANTTFSPARSCCVMRNGTTCSTDVTFD